MNMNRREHLASLGAVTLLASHPARVSASVSQPFSWESLIKRAQERSQKPYQSVKPHAAAEGINYDIANQIEFRANKQLFNQPNSHSSVRFFPLSRGAQMPVNVFVVANGHATQFDYDPTLFEIRAPDAANLLKASAGLSGFRVMNPGGIGDWLAYQSASYFRSAGPLSQYGLSARGLGIDTAVPGKAEEFPSFTDFWLEHTAGDKLIVYAILDSLSICGAYRFVNQKTKNAITQDVTLALFPRKDIAQLCIAPLTSMFWYSESNRDKAVDWRPEIHDSDGLAMYTGKGERIWRPLTNPPKVSTSTFLDGGPKGFGLLQRDRNFDHYQDDSVFYEKRPSLWVEPMGNWGEGAVTLYEIPTARETDDNIGAFWVPANPTKAGSRADYAYRLNWIGDEPQPMHVARAIDVFTGIGGRPGLDPVSGQHKLVIDFEGGKLNTLNPDTPESSVKPAVDVTNGKLIEAHFRPIAGSKGKWRLTADIARSDQSVSDIRIFIQIAGIAITETVLYQLHWAAT
ncbi:MAG TPA: glucan biosynthesis protein [Steroidobacteraceae bacterium]|jgi:glucans biosynthesis protein